MLMNQYKLQILTILFDNLRNPAPQLVPTDSIAQKMDIGLPQLRQVLRTMDGMGIIQTDHDLQYNLITQKGINYLG